ncbi:glycosyltransferase [Pseudoxanthomonas winnipegensis]|uniref:glycosyltransferase n=1 Tax=Pseudoxanthomonas winnipegensis TaxID=2480810 RepID=UPI003F84ED34
MIAVLIPAHDEAEVIGRCLASVCHAANHPELDEAVIVVVASDRCTDATPDIAASFGACVIQVPMPGGVGLARATAAERAIALGADWLAITDADSEVPSDWLFQQRALQTDAFCGVVEVSDWLDYAPETACAFEASEPVGVDHGRIHGANMGVSVASYLRCGGFSDATSSEDVALVKALQAFGARIAWSPYPVVRTSARRQAKASGGFSQFLQRLELSLMQAQAKPLAPLHGQPVPNATEAEG